MPGFDVYTLNAITIANLLVVGCAMMVVWRINQACVGFKWYGIANFVLALGFVFLLLRASIPGKAMILLQHLALWAGALLVLEGLGRFRDLPRLPLALILGVSIAYIAAAAFWLYVYDDKAARIAATSPFYAAISLASAATLGRRVAAADRLVYWPPAILFCLHALAMVARAVDAALAPPGMAVSRGLEIAALTILNVVVGGCAFALSMGLSLRIQRAAENRALYDPLTQLPNRLGFSQQLALAQKRCTARERHLALIYGDLDGFKEINDKFGHSAGDEVLKAVGERLANAVGHAGFLARLGGDEFVLLIEDVRSRDNVADLVSRMVAVIETEFRVGAKTAKLTMSCGFALFPEEVGTTSALIRKADAHMYLQKQRINGSRGGANLAVAGS